ncbi:hypothetical protein QS460_04875 [Liquorilactobacillus mali]|uniref:hypothetical protein n=1 Tax=Liquorilactobacillus mali TaxID=1618 RepID=UPI00264EB2A9|nr:hypothetical protein [Liquorilactobacillus mali]MDN7145257.1 hypothetical protein [Liquorilactobacillus mali]
MNPRIKLVELDADGDVVQVFAETDMYSVIGLLDKLTTIEADIAKLKIKTGVK